MQENIVLYTSKWPLITNTNNWGTHMSMMYGFDTIFLDSLPNHPLQTFQNLLIEIWEDIGIENKGFGSLRVRDRGVLSMDRV